MIIINDEHVTLDTPTGPMRTHIVRPASRPAMTSDVKATACFYATDIHKHGLGKGMQDDSLQRAAEIKGELLMIWGRQDPHIPTEGRMAVLARLNELGTRISWHEV